MNNSMKTENYVASVAEATNNTKKLVRLVIKEFLNQISENTKNGIPSHFVGLGKIEIRDVEAATRRNPSTGEPVHVEAHQKPRFHFSGKIRNTLRGIEEEVVVAEEE